MPKLEDMQNGIKSERKFVCNTVYKRQNFLCMILDFAPSMLEIGYADDYCSDPEVNV